MINENVGKKKNRNVNLSSGSYGMGLIGAIVYYFQHAISFGDGVIGFFKALIWPALVVYNLLEHLKM